MKHHFKKYLKEQYDELMISASIAGQITAIIVCLYLAYEGIVILFG